MRVNREALEAIEKAALEGRVTEGGKAVLPTPTLHADATEEEFTAAVIDLAQREGWRVAHFRPARVLRRGVEKYETPVAADGKGWPDLVLCRGRMALFVELKSGKGKLSPEQEVWRDALRLAGEWWGLWRPTDWPQIVNILVGKS